jgi:hypothetical protein
MRRQERGGRNSMRRPRAKQPCRTNGRRRNVTNVMHYTAEKHNEVTVSLNVYPVTQVESYSVTM